MFREVQGRTHSWGGEALGFQPVEGRAVAGVQAAGPPAQPPSQLLDRPWGFPHVCYGRSSCSLGRPAPPGRLKAPMNFKRSPRPLTRVPAQGPLSALRSVPSGPFSWLLIS